MARNLGQLYDTARQHHLRDFNGRPHHQRALGRPTSSLKLDLESSREQHQGSKVDLSSSSLSSGSSLSASASSPQISRYLFLERLPESPELLCNGVRARLCRRSLAKSFPHCLLSFFQSLLCLPRVLHYAFRYLNLECTR